MPSILALKHAELDARNAEMMARIARETADTDAPVKSARCDGWRG